MVTDRERHGRREGGVAGCTRWWDGSWSFYPLIGALYRAQRICGRAIVRTCVPPGPPDDQSANLCARRRAVHHCMDGQWPQFGSSILEGRFKSTRTAIQHSVCCSAALCDHLHRYSMRLYFILRAARGRRLFRGCSRYTSRLRDYDRESTTSLVPDNVFRLESSAVVWVKGTVGANHLLGTLHIFVRRMCTV